MSDSKLDGNTVFDNSMPAFYIINLVRRKDRRDKMIQRFRYHRLLANVTFIDAVDKDSELVNWYMYGLDPNSYTASNKRAEIACFLSHIKAFRQMIIDGRDFAALGEDDIMLHNDFRQKYQNLMKDLPENTPLLMLSYFMESWDGVGYINSAKTLATHTEKAWGGYLYRVSREYALHALNIFDKPFGYLKGFWFITSELLTIQCRLISPRQALIAVPPLVIEESVKSDIRPDSDIERHVKYFSTFGWDNYNSAEKK